MADASISTRVHEAYIRPIRTVLAIDDEYHQYDSETSGSDSNRAKAIWRACRDRGWLCDIDDGSDLINNAATGHLLKSDVVILDYHLQGDNPKWSLGLLRQLADSEHASLVVVYTKDPKILSVRRAIAAHLRGVKAKDRRFSNAETAGIWDSVEEKLKGIPTEELIEAYIRGDIGRCRNDKAIQDALKAHKVSGPAVPEIIEALFDTAIIDAYGVDPGTLSPKKPSWAGSDNAPWVYVNNLFVVCVVKTTENISNGDLVFKELESALQEWNPDFMLASVAFARGEFARGGFDHERSALSNPNLQAGWLYHAWSGSVDEHDVRLRVLFERIIRSYSGKILNKVIAFGGEHIPKHDYSGASTEALKAAIDLVFKADPPSPERVLHVLNEYLATEEIPLYVETGTIFSPEVDGIKKGHVYLCATPACDLVPRQPSRGWEKQMHPMRPMIAMRCNISDTATKHLETAENGRFIFLTVENKQKSIALVDAEAPVPTLEWFIMDSMGKIGVNNTFKAVKLSRSGKDAGDLITTSTESMKVLGQIRSIYANRILQAAGQHMSRIGVDFVKLPTPTVAKPEESNEVKQAAPVESSVVSQSKVESTAGTQASELVVPMPDAKSEPNTSAGADLPPSPAEQEKSAKQAGPPGDRASSSISLN